MDAVFSWGGIASILATIIATKAIEKIYPVVRGRVLLIRRKSRLNSLKSLRRHTKSSADYLALLSIQSAVISAFFTVMAIAFAIYIVLPTDPVITFGIAIPLMLLEIAALFKKTQADAAKKRMRKLEIWSKKTQSEKYQIGSLCQGE